MISRSALLTLCLGIVVAASLPAGVYASPSQSGSTANESVTQEQGPPEPFCLDFSTELENISMNAYEQDATNLTTESAVVSSTGNGTTAEADMIEIGSGKIHSARTCFDRVSMENETMTITLDDVEFEETTLRGPWTDIEFGHGTADRMIITLPWDQLVYLLRQSPVGESIIPELEEHFGLSAPDDTETAGAENGTDGSANESTGSTANATDSNGTTTATDEATTNGTEPDDENTTDAIDEPRANSTTETTDGVRHSDGTGETETNTSAAEPSETEPRVGPPVTAAVATGMAITGRRLEP
ncbi:hypothetical protein [Natrinema longum]|uniref:Uncharacterized protein n=1 Tax=Natrinema longum TaxID=370324 RepID=A0A8A2UD70_9EURY|nr:hypothetical protein [Natrinema longum]MBZ6495435.1 hypothetical protein [Natrinema longum]QSW86593.1 hypothetical protein J0X27_07200 [Natrinema longum]